MTTPTTADAVSALATRCLLGLLLLGVGWYQASRQVRVADQVPWLALAIVGSVVVALAGALWILALRRSIRQLTASVRGRIARLPTANSAGAELDASELVAVTAPGALGFHAQDCELVAGREFLLYGSRADHVSEGRRPCGACLDG